MQTDHALCAGFDNILTRTRQEPDLMDRAAVRGFFESERPDYLFDGDARVGRDLRQKALTSIRLRV